MPFRRVLVVEDDPDCAEVLEWILRDWGHHVHHATDEATMRGALGTARPDVVLIDGLLGNEDGLELVRRHRQGLLAGLPVVLTTGRSHAEVDARAREVGIERVLYKPYHLPELLRVVEGGGA